MPDKKTTQAIQEGIKEASSSILTSTSVKAGGIAGLLTFLKIYFFPGGSADADPNTGGLQAHKKGRGPAEETLLYLAISSALEELFKEGVDETYLQQQLTTLLATIDSMPPNRRRDTILYLSGLSESLVVTTQGGVSTQSYDNIRGKEICKGLLRMNTMNMQRALQLPVSDSELFKDRLRELNEWCGQVNAQLEAFNQGVTSLEEKRKKNGTNPFSSLWKTIVPSRKKNN